MKRSRSAEESTAYIAYHDAGHVVAAYLLGIPVAKIAITIVPDGDTAGRLMLRLMFQAGELEFGNSDRTKLKAEMYAQVSLSGIVAERRHRLSSIRSWHASHDYQTAHELIVRISGTPEEVRAYRNLILVRAETMVNDPLRLEMYRGDCR